MPRPTALLKRSLIFLHRWLGVALSIIFLLWFVSGIVMMYWTFPGITERDRLQRAPTLESSLVRISPEDAYASLGREQPPAQVTLTSFDGRPVYRFSSAGGRGGGGGRGGAAATVYADDGSQPGYIDDATSDRAAAAWAGRPLSEATKISVEDVDQWTVAGGLRTLRPMYKYSWPDGQQVYVNGTTAEVVQYTTTASRLWAYLGAIPHWMYFTPLRQHQPQWLSFVVWSSFIGAGAALIGVVIAVWMYSPAKRYRHAGAPTSIPYRGWKRWHTITGLFFGVITTTWAFSGTLSMGPFEIVGKVTDLTVGPAPERGTTPNIGTALRGPGGFSLSSYGRKSPADAIASVSGFEVKELEFSSFAGVPFYLASNGHGETRIIPVHGEPKSAFETETIMQVVREASGTMLAELRVIDEYDAYYLDRTGERPLPVVYARMNDSVDTRYYVDPNTGRVALTYSARGWVNRWLYHGLHSLDFPWLYKYRPLWDIVVIALMLGGTAICVTSIVLAWRVLARKITAVFPIRLNPPNEDLATEVK